MDSFDRLPEAVRRRLAESPFDFVPSQIAGDKRRFGLSVPATLVFIDLLERWARETLSRASDAHSASALARASDAHATPKACLRRDASALAASALVRASDGNRLEAALGPDVDELAETARRSVRRARAA